jgi:hypothetical protein
LDFANDYGLNICPKTTSASLAKVSGRLSELAKPKNSERKNVEAFKTHPEFRGLLMADC